MVSRGDLRAAVRSEILTATNEIVDPTNVRVIEADMEEDYPSIIYSDEYSRIIYNGVGRAPDETVYDETGTVIEEIWRQYLEGRFTISLRADSASQLDTLYDAVHRQFQQYHFSGWDQTDVHPHITNMWVGNVSGENDTSTYDILRGDVVEVFIEFYQDYVSSVVPIERIETEFDIEFEGSISDTPSGPTIVDE